MKSTALFCALALCQVPNHHPEDDMAALLPKDVKPNVILVAIDDAPTFLYSLWDEKHPYRKDGENPDNLATDPSGQNVYVQAPTLRRLARNGVVFLNAYAQPFCGPDRACLMSGRYAHNTGLGSQVTGAFEFNTQPGWNDSKPLAVAMNELGYETGLCGKWHLGTTEADGGSGWAHIPDEGGWGYYAATFSNFTIDYVPVGGPLIGDMEPIGGWTDLGSNRYQKTQSSGTPFGNTVAVVFGGVPSETPEASAAAVTSQGQWHLAGDTLTIYWDGVETVDRKRRLLGGHNNYFRNLNGSQDLMQSTYVGGSGTSPEENSTGVYSGERVFLDAEAFVAQAQEPFFLTITPNVPHIPAYDMYPDDESKILTDEFRTGHNSSAGANDLSYASVFQASLEHHDVRLGEFLDSLPADVMARTVVIWTSDNGAPNSLMEDIRDGGGAIPAKNLGATMDALVDAAENRFKNTAYEGSSRVPLLIYGPGISSGVRGTKTQALTHSMDLYTTIVELGKGAPASNVNGVSLLPILKGQQPTVRDRVLIHRFRVNGMPGDHTTISGDFDASDNFDDQGFSLVFTDKGALNGRYKLVRKYVGGGSYTSELYWLEGLDGLEDPTEPDMDRWEQVDLWGNATYSQIQTEIVAALDAELLL